MEPGESNPADEGQNSNENDSPTEKIKSKLGIYIFNLQNWTVSRSPEYSFKEFPWLFVIIWILFSYFSNTFEFSYITI